jgi:hypothetical protein
MTPRLSQRRARTLALASGEPYSCAGEATTGRRTFSCLKVSSGLVVREVSAADTSPDCDDAYADRSNDGDADARSRRCNGPLEARDTVCLMSVKSDDQSDVIVGRPPAPKPVPLVPGQVDRDRCRPSALLGP